MSNQEKKKGEGVKSKSNMLVFIALIEAKQYWVIIGLEICALTPIYIDKRESSDA